MTRDTALAIAARVSAELFGDGQVPVLDDGQRRGVGDALLLAALEGIEGDGDER